MNKRVILIIEDSYDENEVIDAILAGARGYLLKDSNSEQLKKAIDSVNEGQLWIERRVTGKAFDALLCPSNDKKRKARSNSYNLTNTELIITKMVMDGDSNRKIADRMYLSERTIKFHLYKIFKKLSLKNRSELILYGFRKGIVN